MDESVTGTLDGVSFNSASPRDDVMAVVDSQGVLVVADGTCPKHVVSGDSCIDVKGGRGWDRVARSQEVRVVDVAPLVNPVGFPVGDRLVKGIARGVVDRLSVDDPVGLLIVGSGGRESGIPLWIRSHDEDLSHDILSDRHLHHGVGVLT